MISEVLREKYSDNEPIFTSEILSLFSDYSRQYVQRKLKEEEDEGLITKFSKGVYFFSTPTLVGPSSISSTHTVEKKYITDGKNIYGIYSGITLQNEFGLTTQVTNKREIVTNNESTRKRKIVVNGIEFILRKSRTTITNENVYAYTIMQLFSERNGITPDKNGLENIRKYALEHNVTMESFFELMPYFPAKTAINVLLSEVLRRDVSSRK